MFCRFQTDIDHFWRCDRCGFMFDSTLLKHVKDPARLFRQCDVIVFDQLDARGFGDSVAIAASKLGIKPWAGCRCPERQRKLNAWLPFNEEDVIELGPMRRGLARVIRATCDALGLAIVGPRKMMYLQLNYGFGDAVQFSVILNHLKHYRPDWTVDIGVPPGCETMFDGLCRKVFVSDNPPPREHYRIYRDLWLEEPGPVYAEWPSTKMERMLQEVFRFDPVPELCGYTCNARDADRELVAKYLADIPGPRLLIHYQGSSIRDRKTLDEQVARQLIRRAQQAGWSVILHDFGQSKLTNLPGVHNPGENHWIWGGHRFDNGSAMIALSEVVDFHFDIDSGPGHCLIASGTRGAVYWSKHHPLHFMPPTDNVTHLVPQGHDRYIGHYTGPTEAEWQAGLDFFVERYNARFYRNTKLDVADLVLHLMGAVKSKERLCSIARS